MTVALDPNLEAYVDHLVEVGRYDTRQAVLAEGVRLLAVQEMRLAELRSEIEAALDDPRASITDEEVGARLEEVFAELRAQASA